MPRFKSRQTNILSANFVKCDCIFNRDLPVIQTYVLFIGVLFVVFNLVFDILQTVSDPRLRRES